MANVTKETTVKKKTTIPKGPSRAKKPAKPPSAQEKKDLEGLIRHDKNRRGIFTGKK